MCVCVIMIERTYSGMQQDQRLQVTLNEQDLCEAKNRGIGTCLGYQFFLRACHADGRHSLLEQ